MVQPRMVHPNIRLHDITTLFHTSAAKLRAGGLVKDEHFTLFEAVSALEIGDPKMDSGSLDPELGIEEAYDFGAPMTATQAIWLMDELIYREVSWHQGYPLSQTLFTSIHLERLLWPEPRSVADASFHRDSPAAVSNSPTILNDVLQPFCLALIKCCDLVLTMVSEQHYYEEEDFATQVFNRPLLTSIPARDILSIIDQARSQLYLLDLESELREALKSRLDFRFFLLDMLQKCAQGVSTDQESMDNTMMAIDVTEKSTVLGQPTAQAAFTLEIQRRLASSVPPRPMIVTDKEGSFAFMRQLVIHSTQAFELFEVQCSVDLMVAYESFMTQKPQPSVYVRALLQSFLTLQDKTLGQFSLREFIARDLRLFVLPNSILAADGTEVSPSMLSDEQSQTLSQFDYFVNRCGQSYLNLFRTMCLNRCRARRVFCHAALEWDQIQAEAEELDEFIQNSFGEQARVYPGVREPTFSYSLSSWVYHYKLTQLRHIVQIGFELSIYGHYEYPSMYWHLSYLANIHIAHLERISFFVSCGPQETKRAQENSQRTLQQLYRHFRWLKGTESLAKALHKVYTVLKRHGHLLQPRRTYSSDRLRYELRMRPFQHLSIPEPLSPDVAEAASSLEGYSDLLLLDEAMSLNQTAKKAWEEVLKAKWNFQPLSTSGVPDPVVRRSREGVRSSQVFEREWVNDVRNSIKSCIGVGITISALIKILQKSSTSDVKGVREMEVNIPNVGHRDRWHAAWAVPRVTG